VRELWGGKKTLEPQTGGLYIYIEKERREKTYKKKLVKNKLRTPQKRIYNERRGVFSAERTCQTHWEGGWGNGGRSLSVFVCGESSDEVWRGRQPRDVYARWYDKD